MWQVDGREEILYREKIINYFAEAQTDSNYPAS
jgi:hypothetical protein